MNTLLDDLRAEGRAEGRKEGRAKGRKEGRQEGRAEGRAEAVVELLAARKIKTSASDRKRILECRDLEQLRQWLVGAATAKSVASLLATH